MVIVCYFFIIVMFIIVMISCTIIIHDRATEIVNSDIIYN